MSNKFLANYKTCDVSVTCSRSVVFSRYSNFLHQ